MSTATRRESHHPPKYAARPVTAPSCPCPSPGNACARPARFILLVTFVATGVLGSLGWRRSISFASPLRRMHARAGRHIRCSGTVASAAVTPPRDRNDFKETIMLYYAALFFVIALVAALFGFGGIAA